VVVRPNVEPEAIITDEDGRRSPGAGPFGADLGSEARERIAA
jgi:hypothetical protein